MASSRHESLIQTNLQIASSLDGTIVPCKRRRPTTSEKSRVGRQTCDKHRRAVRTCEHVDELGDLRSPVVELGCDKGKVLMKRVDRIDTRVKDRGNRGSRWKAM